MRVRREDELRRAVIRNLDAEFPRGCGQLDGVYASRGSIPQDRPTPSGAGAHASAWSSGGLLSLPGKRKGARVARRGAMVAVAAVLVVLLSGVAFAASRLVQILPGDVGFSRRNNLPLQQLDWGFSLNARWAIPLKSTACR
ncbi:MAG: hypothetical protein ACLTMP_09305 [Eggerthella lenta]